jgi:hypothetical protein
MIGLVVFSLLLYITYLVLAGVALINQSYVHDGMSLHGIYDC